MDRKDNRIQLIRIAQKYDEETVAARTGIDIDKYKLMEDPTKRVDDADYEILSKFFKVPVAFLQGREFVMTRKWEDWTSDEQDDYEKEDRCTQTYLKFRYGKGEFEAK